MRIVFLLRQDPDETTKKIMDIQARDNEVVKIDIRAEKDYDRVVEEIVNSDRVISW